MGIYTKSINILDEGCLYRSSNYKGKADSISISLYMEGDQKHSKGYVEDPYLKVENSSSYGKAGEELRFSMKTGKIILHSGKGHMEYNKDLGKLLNEILDRKCNIGKYKGKLSVYDAFYQDLQDRFSEYEITKFDKPDFTINS